MTMNWAAVRKRKYTKKHVLRRLEEVKDSGKWVY
jgi:hypothetical protein